MSKRKTPIVEMRRRCATCGRMRGIRFFGTDRRRKDGVSLVCMECAEQRRTEVHRIAVRKYDATHREQLRERAARYRQERPDKLRETRRKYYTKNRFKILAAQARYNEEHPDRRRATQRKYAVAHVEQRMRYQKQYKKNNRLRVRARQIVADLVRRGLLVPPKACQRCGRTGRKLGGHHRNYFFPKQVVWMCASCHARLSGRLKLGRRSP